MLLSIIFCRCEHSEAIKRHGIFMILASHTFDCHEASASRNDTMSATKSSLQIFIIFCHCE